LVCPNPIEITDNHIKENRILRMIALNIIVYVLNTELNLNFSFQYN